MIINKPIKIKNGFTLIEIIVSLFIIVTLTTILLVNYHFTNRRAALITAAQKLASDIRLAQEYSLGSKEFNGSVPQGGWGVYLNTTSPNNKSYIIFADNNGINGYESGEELQTVNLPTNIIVDSINTGSPITNATILFIPPDPMTKINSDDLIKSVRITLKESGGNTIKSVEVNFLGLVDVAD